MRGKLTGHCNGKTALGRLIFPVCLLVKRVLKDLTPNNTGVQLGKPTVHKEAQSTLVSEPGSRHLSARTKKEEETST